MNAGGVAYGMGWTRRGSVTARSEAVQTVRRRITEILKENGSATVAQLADHLGMAQVSVRHHLDILVGEDLVELAGVQRHSGAGRPSQVYSLTPNAAKLFPQRHEALANNILAELKASLSSTEVRGILQRVAVRTAQDAPLPETDETLDERLDRVAQFLTEHGYNARWETADGRYELHVCNCPYAGVADHHPELCSMDGAMVQALLPSSVREHARIANGAPRCSYVIGAAPADGADA
jgi:predicted ArsR family transcriptional regulator